MPVTWEKVYEKIQEGTYIDPVTGCYEWLGHSLPSGYGIISWQGKGVYIHRLVFEKLTGIILEVLRHTCDNPCCWNLQHLRNGSHADNVDDKVEKGRHSFGANNWNSKLTDDQVKEIKISQQSAPELAQKYGVSRAVIHNIWDGRSWKHVK